MTELPDWERNANGTFAPGSGGRPPGIRNRTTRAVQALLDGEADKLTRKAVDMALEGDTTALRLCLERLAPPRKDAPIEITMPPVRSAADVVEASSAVLGAVAVGDVTPDEAGRLMTLLTAHRAIIETNELEQRIAALEKGTQP